MNTISIRSSFDADGTSIHAPSLMMQSLTASRRFTLSTTLHDAEYWLKRAKEARAQAEQMPSAEDKRLLLDIAGAYERLAELAVDNKS